MHKKLRVLCLYGYVPDGGMYSDPRMDLWERDVVVVDTYDEAIRILEASQVVPPFDVVLSDLNLFHNRSDADLPVLNPLFLLRILAEKLVGGLGIFVPKGYESNFESSDGYMAIVASQECWTPNGSRDWEKLLRLVISASEKEEFSSSC